MWDSIILQKDHRKDVKLSFSYDFADLFSSITVMEQLSSYEVLKLMDLAVRLPSQGDRVKYLSQIFIELKSTRRKAFIEKQSLEYPRRVLLAVEAVFPHSESLEGRDAISQLLERVLSRLVKESHKVANTEMVIDLVCRSERFRTKFNGRISVVLDGVSDYHLTLVPVLVSKLNMLSDELIDKALSMLIMRKAYSKLIRFYSNLGSEEMRRRFTASVRESVETVDDMQLLPGLMTVVGFVSSSDNAREFLLHVIEKNREKDWTPLLVVPGYGLSVEDIGKLASLKNPHCSEINWVNWLSRLEPVSGDIECEITRSLDVIKGVLKRGVSDNTKILAESFFNISRKYPNIDCEISANCGTVQKEQVRDLAELLNRYFGGATNGTKLFHAWFVSIGVQLVQLCETSSWFPSMTSNESAQMLTLIGHLVQRLDYSDTRRMDVFHCLSAGLPEVDPAAARLVPRKVITEQFIMGLPGAKNQSLFRNRIS